MNNQNIVYTKLTTTIKQNGDIEQQEFKYQAQACIAHDKLYISYEEKNEELGKVNVLFKCKKDGTLEIHRKAAEKKHKSILFFKNNETLSAIYQTPIGGLDIQTKTYAMETSLSDNPLKGEIKIKYFLYAQGASVGDYEISLQFSKEKDII